MIDFHTHVYPDKLADKIINNLADKFYWGHFSDGTISGLQKSRKEAGIRICVTQPVLTKPSHFESINDFCASQFNIPGLIPFGAIHPDCDNIKSKLIELKKRGFKGIKLHPDWQKMYLSEKRCVFLVRTALELDFIVLIHTGYDGAFPDSDLCTPIQSLKLIEQLEDPGHENRKLVLAHNGGHLQHEEVRKYLLGANTYFDISLSHMYISDNEFMELVKEHGKDKLLFGTDSPYADQKESVNGFFKRPLTKDEFNMISELNACSLLGI